MENQRHENEGFPTTNLFADSQQYHHAYEDLFPPPVDSNNNFDPPTWPTAGYSGPSQSRVWQPNNGNADHPSASPAPTLLHGPYGRDHSNSPAAFAQNGQQAYQYRPQQFDAARSTSNQDFSSAFPTYGNPTQYNGTVAPHALEHESRLPPLSRSPYEGMDVSRSMRPAMPSVMNPKTLIASIPTGNLDIATRMSIIDYDQLSQATNSRRVGNFVNIGKDVFEFGINRTPIPVYFPRKSRNELKKMAGNNPALLAKLGKKSTKKQRMMVPTQSVVAKAPRVNKPTGSPLESIVYEGDSSSETDTSDDDDDSAYTSDEEIDGSPLPGRRPDSPKAATEYDTIKALWRSKRKSLDKDTIRNGIVEFWEILKTVRDRWKADQTALMDAEEKKKTGELPLLKSRVKDQRDMMETAFRTALKHGHMGILELLGENASLLFVCYQFLLDRWKEDEANSSLARAILDLLAILTTVDDEKLEKTYLKRLFPKYITKADAKTQWLVKKIMATSSANSKAKPAETKPAKSAATSAVPTKTSDIKAAAGLKRAATSAGEGALPKKVATGSPRAGGVAATAKVVGVIKKPGTISGGLSVPAVKTKVVASKPLGTGFFASLQSVAGKKSTPLSAAKPVAKHAEIKATPTPQNAAPKSTFSFAETMANISKPKEAPKAPPKAETVVPLAETGEEKTKRLRKEERRKLHVMFKAGDALVEVRYFTHDPDEELGHDSSQMRDVADVGGEGRMLKMQNQMMDVDEDDEAADSETLVAFNPPSLVDFSTVPEEERSRNYDPYGGGKLVVESPEQVVRDGHEANTLMVFYSSPSDIPPNPREPSDPYNGLHTSTFKRFDHPDDGKYLLRARQRKAAQPQAYYSKGSASALAVTNAAALGHLFNAQHQQQAQQTAAAPASVIDLQKILASLQPAAPAQTPVVSASYPAPMANGIPTSAPAQPDISAILAALNQTQMQGGQASYQMPTASAPMVGYQGQPQGASVFENPDRVRLRDGGMYENNENNHHNTNNSSNFQHHDNDSKGWLEKVYRTKVCHFWTLGKCKKGDDCTYLHEYPANQ